MAKAQTGKHGGPSHHGSDTGEEIPADEKITPNEPGYPGGQPGEKRPHEEARAREEAYRKGETRPKGEAYPDRDTYAREAEEERLGSTPESRAAARSIGAAGTTVKTGIAASLRGIDEIETEIVSLVRNTVSNSIRATGAVGSEAVNITRDVVKGALAATEDLGTGLVVTTKSVAKGVALGVSDVGGGRHLGG